MFTIALGTPGSDTHLTMARMLVSSLLATGYDGTIAAIVGPGVTLARTLPPNVIEIRVPETDARSALGWKFRSRARIEAARYRRVLYLDSDCLAIDDIRPLLDGDWDLGYVPEYGTARSLTYFNTFLTDDEMRADAWGINAGTFAVRGSRFAEVMAEWERVIALPPRRPPWREGTDQPAWNRVVLDTNLATHAIPEGVVRLPFVARRAPPVGVTPRIVHFAGAPPDRQLQEMCRVYFDTFGVTTR